MVYDGGQIRGTYRGYGEWSILPLRCHLFVLFTEMIEVGSITLLKRCFKTYLFTSAWRLHRW